MAHSLRSGSLNDIFNGSSKEGQMEVIGNKLKSASSPDLRKSKFSLTDNVKMTLNHLKTPVSTMYNRASEAHIHRIREANSRAECRAEAEHKIVSPSISFGNKISLNGLAPPMKFKRSIRLPSIIEEDEDETESLDWTSPFDITNYLFRPKYIIQREEDVDPEEICVVECDDEDEDKSHYDISVTQGGAVGSECNSSSEEDKVNISIKGDQTLIGKYSLARDSSTTANGNSKQKNSLINCQGIQDYPAFIKQLNNEIRDISIQTKRLEIYSPRSDKKLETKQETLGRGYDTLKRIYQLNPELTESAAKRHICGPPGNQWMGLSRVEMIGIMKKIRKEFGASPRNYVLRSSIQGKLSMFRKNSSNISSTVYHLHEKKRGSYKKQSSYRKSGAAVTKREKTVLKPPMARLKLSQLPNPMEHHVPGPKHLHTNICIRPWEPSLEGWSQVDDINDNNFGAVAYNSEEEDLSKIGGQTDNSEMTFNEPETKIFSDEDGNPQNPGDNDFITLEVFNPTFRLQT